MSETPPTAVSASAPGVSPKSSSSASRSPKVPCEAAAEAAAAAARAHEKQHPAAAPTADADSASSRAGNAAPARVEANKTEAPGKSAVEIKKGGGGEMADARSKVRFDEASKLANATAAAREAKPAATKPEATGGTATESRDIQCDCTAEWARSENLTASLVRQRSENPDEVFFPLPHQRTCELADIFSAPRRRERGKGSGEWTPMSSEYVTRSLFPAGATGAAGAPKEGAAPSSHVSMHLFGVDGEYMGEQLPLPPIAIGSSAKIFLIGRSSSCDVTLSRDDQISRRHMQIEARDGKLMARDLGSTYGTRVNGKALGAEAVELKAGDVLMLGASSFQLQAVGGK